MKKEDFYDRFSAYENDEELDEDGLGGHLPKNLIRLNDNSINFDEQIKANQKSQDQKTIVDSVFFKDLFESLKDVDCYYITYLNDLLKNNKESDKYYPKYVSCLVKRIREINKYAFYNECIGCQLSNLLGLDTAYNTANSKDDDPESYDFLISVDVVSKGQEIVNLDELGVIFYVGTPFYEIMDDIYEKIPEQIRMRNQNISDEDLYKMLREFQEKFIMQYLFRNILCEDSDYGFSNVIAFINDDGKISMGPNIDMELMFQGHKDDDVYKTKALGVVTYLQNLYPKVLQNFMSRLNESYQSGEILNIMKNGFKIDKAIKKRAINIIERNVKILNEVVAQVQKNSLVDSTTMGF